MLIGVARPGVRVIAEIAWHDGAHKGNCTIMRSYFRGLWGWASAAYRFRQGSCDPWPELTTIVGHWP
jgi:hypothetical protein